MNSNIDKCSVMQIFYNIHGNYNMSKQQLSTKDKHQDLGIININVFKWQKQAEKLQRALGLIDPKFEYKNKQKFLPLYKSC